MFYGFVKADKALCPGIFLVCYAGLSYFLGHEHQHQHWGLKVFPPKDTSDLGQSKGQSMHVWHRLENTVLRDDF